MVSFYRLKQHVGFLHHMKKTILLDVGFFEESYSTLGWHKTFNFTSTKEDQPSNQGNGLWSMHEYSLNDDNLSDYVICKIENKGDRKRKTPEVNDEENHDLIKKKDAAERQNKKRKPPEVNDGEKLTPAPKELHLDDRAALETHQQKFPGILIKKITI
ncbi:hypothetical protein DITRI_Ditri15bG0030100 [Diplodiscus trichospermus]